MSITDNDESRGDNGGSRTLQCQRCKSGAMAEVLRIDPLGGPTRFDRVGVLEVRIFDQRDASGFGRTCQLGCERESIIPMGA